MTTNYLHKLLAIAIGLLVIVSCEDIISVPDISTEMVTILAPIENTVVQGDNTTFSWEENTLVDRYQVQVATPSFDTPVQIVLDTIIGDSIQGFRQFTTPLVTGEYQWRIRGINSDFETGYTTTSFSVIDTTTPANISGETVALLAPINDPIIENAEINFTWDAIPNATEYIVQVATPNFISPIQILVNQSVNDASTTHTLEDGDYEWRVKAVNDSFETSYSTDSFSVDLNANLDDQLLTIIAPPDDFVTSNSNISLEWQQLDLATQYRVMIIDMGDNSIFLEDLTNETSLVVEFVSGTYTWKVRGENAQEQTLYTEQTITIQ